MTEKIERALATLFPDGGIVELRALTDHSVHSGYFDDFDLLTEKAESLDGLPDVAGIYVTLNTVNPALLSRRSNRMKMNLGYKVPTTSDADILCRRWFPIDLDPVRPSGVSSTNEEHEAAISRAGQIAAWLAEQGFPEPIKADSGNGAHLLYRIDLPNDEEATKLVKGCLAVLDTLFSNEKVNVDAANFNAARIWKLYGTASRKGDNTTERPHRRSAILSVPDKVDPVSVEQLRSLLATLPCKDPGAGKVKAGSLVLPEWLLNHGIGVRSERVWQGGTLYVLSECPFSGAHRDGAFAVQFPSGAIYAGCHHASCGAGTQRWPELREMFKVQDKKAGKRKKDPSEETGSLMAKGLELPPREVSPPPPPPLPTDAVIAGARLIAEDVLRSGDPPGFLLNVFQKSHVGDHVIAECLILSVASQSVVNTQGLHVAISGNSGKGKTHACRTMLNLVPEQFRIRGTVSNKALYYHPLRPGTVLLFDDVALSDDLQEVLKSATANFREPIEHRTLTSDRQVRTCQIPERCVWWLAKVEAAGDDQVMNRMLCVWIDDSATQDAAVLTHLKEAEARNAPSGEDPDVPVCRAIWERVKEEVLYVRIPFAPQIHFSASQNRRNPGMLFDLIKCHARLFFLQRQRDESGSIVATREDFMYARQLFLNITAETGGQETKQTRNEAAALSTMAKMGLQVFTIKNLQDALGLSYHQIYRLLKGYQNNKGTYQGILDKCPAVSYIDATVAEDLYGVEVKRHEHYFSFDPILYKLWTAGSEIWLEDEVLGPNHKKGQGPDYTIASDSQPGSVNENENPPGPGSIVVECSTVKDTSLDLSLDDLHSTHNTSPAVEGDGGCVRDQEQSVNENPLPSSGAHSENTTSSILRSSFINNRKDSQCHGKNIYSGINPLPGLLDHRDFKRVKIPSSKCDICHEGNAEFRSKEKQIGICERCYTKLVRDWNERMGVR